MSKVAPTAQLPEPSQHQDSETTTCPSPTSRDDMDLSETQSTSAATTPTKSDHHHQQQQNPHQLTPNSSSSSTPTDIKQQPSNNTPNNSNNNTNDAEKKPPKPKPHIVPISFDLPPAETLESALKARIEQYRKERLARLTRFTDEACASADAKKGARGGRSGSAHDNDDQLESDDSDSDDKNSNNNSDKNNHGGEVEMNSDGEMEGVEGAGSGGSSSTGAGSDRKKKGSSSKHKLDSNSKQLHHLELAHLSSQNLHELPQSDITKLLSSHRIRVTETTVLGARRAAVRRGFPTGFDIEDPSEVAKRAQRVARFGPPDPPPDDEAARDARAERFGALALADVIAFSAEPPLELRRNVRPDEQAAARENVLHVFGVDRLSTREIVGHFAPYGPSWCEWLNDSSCNVVFEDVYTLARVLRGMSIAPEAEEGQEANLPNEPKEDEAERGRAGGKGGKEAGKNKKKKKKKKTENGDGDGEMMEDVKSEEEMEEDAEEQEDDTEDEAEEEEEEEEEDSSLRAELKWRAMKPFNRSAGAIPIWGRMATEKDIRPERPNPKSRWSRTMQNKRHSVDGLKAGKKGDGKGGGRRRRRSDGGGNAAGQSSGSLEGGRGGRPSRSGTNLGLKKQKGRDNSIAKAVAKRMSSMDLDKPLGS